MREACLSQLHSCARALAAPVRPAQKAHGASRLLLMVVLAAVSGCAKTKTPLVLRVCADPNNLPFSDRAERGFENRIAEILADELEARLEYTWLPQRKGFLRAALGEGRCDVVIGVPAGLERALTTRPYYRSSSIFVTSVERSLDVAWCTSDPAVVEPGEPDRFFTFDIAVGVRSGRDELRDELQRALDRRHREIIGVLEAFGIPLLALPQQEARR
jgi:hypothetical protein